MRSIRTTAIALAALSLVSTGGVQAQTETQPLPERCKAEPAPPATGEGQPADPSTTENLTDKLDDCNAVLAPPAVGDGEIVAPPPDTGTTPVIRPEEVPPQDGSAPQ